MEKEIKNNLDNPEQLEKLYRDSKAQFKKAFNLIYPDIQHSTTAQIWNTRLNFEHREISWGTKNEPLVVMAISLIAGVIAKLPDLVALDHSYYYPRNMAFVIFPMLAAYFAWKQALQIKKALLVFGTFLFSAIYINTLPHSHTSDTLLLACIHLPLFMWVVSGYAFTGERFRDYQKRIDFLRYNGDLIVMTTIILIAGAILSVVTIGLFALINAGIEEYYFRNIAIWGLASAPIVGTYLVQSNPQLVRNVSPVIAKVFTPLVLAMLIVYMIAIVYTGKDPYNDRDFLLIFNLLLIGVMAIILFSIAETAEGSANKTGTALLFSLSAVTIIVNGIALSAIVFRISEWGITPNRIAVLGGNILILVNLLVVTFRLFKILKGNNDPKAVEKNIASFLPVYGLWTVLVTFVFPWLFSFK